jgi:hypothetical protein
MEMNIFRRIGGYFTNKTVQWHIMPEFYNF